MKKFKPMKAVAADFAQLQFPVAGSAKLDGIRAAVWGGQLLSNQLKLIPNAHVQGSMPLHRMEGFDGELIVGSPTADDVYRQSNSVVMSHNKVADFTYYVFDLHDLDIGFEQRLDKLQTYVANTALGNAVKVVPQMKLDNMEQLLEFEALMVGQGYEGVMLRSLDGKYKFGRSTVSEGYLLKVKRFEHSECEIVGIEEEMHNTNEAQTNELGRTQRSTAKEGLVGKGTMGALRVRDIHHGWEFKIGTGFTAGDRAKDWKLGSLHRYKYFPVGMKDVPRHPVYDGPRDRRDL